MTALDPLISFLELEEIDTNLYRGAKETWQGNTTNIFGGQIAAQALRAAAFTVPAGRMPHSLHGYFLRSGDPAREVLFSVDRDRDGRSMSARRVSAVQLGDVIFNMAASFHVVENGPEYSLPRRAGIVGPHDLPVPTDSFWHQLIDVRIVPPVDGGWTREGSLDRIWTRVNVALPDDPIVHACMLAFMSDIGAGFGDLDIPGLPPFGPTIDHAVWFHGAARADRWVLFDSTPIKVGGGRGLYMSSAHAEAGSLVMMLSQEMQLRTTT